MFLPNLFLLAGSVLGQQTVLSRPSDVLDTLQDSSEFTAVHHPLFPFHSVRIKKTHNFCDETVNVYTGYIDAGRKHHFFYFFESRRDPANDPVTLWTNGGPGSSSAMGLLMELGPCRVTKNGTERFDGSWNSESNIIFIDQPAGVGFSYVDYGDPVSTSKEAAQDAAAFVAIFFEYFEQFKGRAFHLSGESYAGRYLPLFASEIYDNNAKLMKAGATPINITSVLVGNGLFDVFTEIPSHYEFSCTKVREGTLPPVGISACVALRQLVPRCIKWMKESCQDVFEAVGCKAASACFEVVLTPYMLDLGGNPYDIRTPLGCGENYYKEEKWIESYLNTPSTKKLLGVDAHRNFTMASDAVHQAFEDSLDMFRTSIGHVAALLERGIKVLIYVGDVDFIANWISQERWIEKMEWSGKTEYTSLPMRDWKVNGTTKAVAGMTKRSGGFTFATVAEAGHLVPYDKPQEALVMYNRWISGQEV